MAGAGGEDLLLRLLDDPEVQAAGEDTESARDTSAIPTQALPFSLPPDLLSKLPLLLSTLGSAGKGGACDEKTALLLALKPYMSPQRCDAIDKLIMLGRLGEIMRQLQ